MPFTALDSAQHGYLDLKYSNAVDSFNAVHGIGQCTTQRNSSLRSVLLRFNAVHGIGQCTTWQQPCASVLDALSFQCRSRHWTVHNILDILLNKQKQRIVSMPFTALDCAQRNHYYFYCSCYCVSMPFTALDCAQPSEEGSPCTSPPRVSMPFTALDCAQQHIHKYNGYAGPETFFNLARRKRQHFPLFS